MYMCKQVGLDSDDMEVMTVDACLSYIEEYVARRNPNKKHVRKARQEDFDNF